MIEYINELIDTLLRVCRSQSISGVQQQLGKQAPNRYDLLGAIATELARLDARDFEPSFRKEFIIARLAITREANNERHDGDIPDLIAKIPPMLEHYAGEGTLAKTRDFSFVSRAEVRAIIERDYRELNLRAFPDGAWKSTVILAGSILEAVLYDMLTRTPAAAAAAMASPVAPKGRDILKHDRANEWTLNKLIAVACDLKILPFDNEKAIHEALREYRNFVHARVEIQKGIPVSEGHATAAKGMLDVILDHLT